VVARGRGGGAMLQLATRLTLLKEREKGVQEPERGSRDSGLRLIGDDRSRFS